MEGAFFLISALLLVSGGSKLLDPGPTAGAMRASGLPSSRVLVLLLGVTEIGLGSAALAFGGSPAGWAIAVLYLSFALFVINALVRKLPIGSCGCFGKVDTPPTFIHAVVNFLAVVVATWAAVTHSSSMVDLLSVQPLAGIPYLVFVASGTYLLFLLLGELPRVLSYRKPVPR